MLFQCVSYIFNQHFGEYSIYYITPDSVSEIPNIIYAAVTFLNCFSFIKKNGRLSNLDRVMHSLST